MPLRNLLLLFVMVVVSLTCYHKRERNRYAGPFSEAIAEVRARYVKVVDDRKLFEAAMQGMVSVLDQHSEYMGPEAYQRFRTNSIDLEFEGIGIVVVKQDDQLIVITPLLGGPAYQAGIEADDQILAIDGVSTKDLTIENAAQRIKGVRDTAVELTILHLGAAKPTKITVRRGTVRLESVLGDRRGKDGTWRFDLKQNPRIKYFQITAFAERTVGELSTRLDAFKKQNDLDAIVIDLRGNAGGLLSSAVAMCDLFISKGVIVTVEGRGDVLRETYSATASGTFVDPAIAVLIDGDSASASEIVAACLQDYHRSAIIGRQSYGKGSVQNMIKLEGGRSALKLTTARYLPPSGRNIHRNADNQDDLGAWGVRPDDGFEIELTEKQADELAKARRRRGRVLGKRPRPETDQESLPLADPQLEKAVEYLEAKIKALDAAKS